MSESPKHSPQDFETVLSGSATSVASFEQKKTLLDKFQSVLHSNPALVPLIVLMMSLLVFGAILGEKFFSPFAMTLILQQVAIVGFVGAAQTLVILTAGIDLSVGAIMVLSSVVMGQATFRYGLPAELAIICGFAVGWAVWPDQWSAGCLGTPASVYRHLRHVANRTRHQLPLLS